jgi:hypothetical protein
MNMEERIASLFRFSGCFSGESLFFTEFGLIIGKSLFFSDFQANLAGLLMAFSVSVLGAVYFLSL